MSYGLIQSGRHMKGEAMGGLSDAARNDQNREMTNQSLKNAKKQQEITSMASGATTGAMIGAKVGAGTAATTAATAAGGAGASAATGAQAGAAGGPMGILIGAGIGLLAGWALS